MNLHNFKVVHLFRVGQIQALLSSLHGYSIILFDDAVI